MTVLPNSQMGQLYFGKRIKEREDYSYLLETMPRPMASCVYDTDKAFSMEHIKQEYGTFGATDYRIPAAEVIQENGNRIFILSYKSFTGSVGDGRLADYGIIRTVVFDRLNCLRTVIHIAYCDLTFDGFGRLHVRNLIIIQYLFENVFGGICLSYRRYDLSRKIG